MYALIWIRAGTDSEREIFDANRNSDVDAAYELRRWYDAGVEVEGACSRRCLGELSPV